MKFLSIAFCILLSLNTAANDTDARSEMLHHFNLVKAKVDAKETSNQDLVDSAKKAFDLALKLKEPKESVSTVGYYYLKAMGDSFNADDKGRVLNTVYENDKGTEYQNISALNLIKYYMVSRKTVKAREIITETLKANETNLEELAELNYQIGSYFLLNHYGDKKIFDKSRKYFERSIELYNEVNPKKVAIANFWLGKYFIAAKRYTQAVTNFETAINVFEQQPEQSKMTQIAESYLLRALVKSGDDEKASELCQKIGRVRPWDDGGDIEPLFIQEPLYPRAAAISGREATLRLKFTVDTNGFAKNVEAIEVMAKSYKSDFIKAAKRALKEWRFAPKFEDGKAVEATAFYTLQFKLAD